MSVFKLRFDGIAIDGISHGPSPIGRQLSPVDLGVDTNSPELLRGDFANRGREPGVTSDLGPLSGDIGSLVGNRYLVSGGVRFAFAGCRQDSNTLDSIAVEQESICVRD